MKIRIFDAQRRFAMQSGYGVMAKEIFENLRALEQEIVFYPDDNTGQDVVLWIRPPHYIKYPEFKKENFNVFFTMHETETFVGWKSDWPELLNKCNLIITPTQWNKEVFINNGVTVPIEVVPLGVSSKVYHGNKTYQFSIMTHHANLGSKGSRENWKDTLTAYFDAFYDFHQNEVILNIKSYEINYEDYKAFLNSLQQGKDPDKLPLVNIIDTVLEPVDLNSLYGQHWMFIKNANREGFSLPIWEAMATGIKVACTDLPVFSDVSEKYAKRFPLGDTQALTDIMLHEFRQWKKHRGYINKYSWKQITKQLLDILKQYKGDI